MFEQALVITEAHDRRTYSTLLGVLTQTVLVTAAVMVPMLFPETLPRMETVVSIFTAPGPPPAPPAPQPATAAKAPVRDFQMHNGTVTAPVAIPDTVARIDEPPLTGAELNGDGGPGGVIGGVKDGIPGGLANLVAAHAVAPPPPPAPQAAPVAAKPAPAAAITRIKTGGLVQEAMIIHRVIPIYPPIARQMRIAGAVELVGIIGRDGHVQELKVASGHPLLVRAALEAVRQWVYRPTMLNGDPVEVVAPITVTFLLH
jgi:periplasmic protein TonB